MTFDTDGTVAVISINRPDVKNAVDKETAAQLAAAFRRLENDKSLLVGVLTGTNETFCSGADLKAISSGNFNRLEDEGDGPMGPSRMQLYKPMIAAVAGYAVAGGMELACLCDMRVVEADAIFGVFCRRWGVPLIDGGTVRVTRMIGMSRALDLVLTGRPVDANEAFAIGLANRIVPKGQSKAAAITLAKEIAAFPQECMLADRQSVYHQHNLSLEDAIKNEFKGGKPIAQNKLQAGVKRFIDKEYKMKDD